MQQLLDFLKRHLSTVFLIIFLVIIGWYFLAHLEDFRNLLTIPWPYLVAILLLQFLIILINVVFLSIILRMFGIAIKFNESFKITSYSSIANFFGFIQSGVGIRAIYLKKKFNFPYKHFALTFAGNYLIIFLVSAIFATFALLMLGAPTQPAATTLFMIFLVASIFFAVLLFIPQIKIGKKFKVISKINQVLEGWRRIVRNPIFLAKLSSLAVLQFLVTTLLYYLELQAVGVAVSWWSATVFASVANFAILLALTPASIGFREGMLILSQASMNITTPEILASSLIDRAAYFFILLILYVYLNATSFKKESQ